MLSHKHIIYDSYDSVYCLTCLDLRSFISFLQGPAHKLRKRRMHRMHRMHWICKRFWSRSPNISKPHPHPPGTSYAATQLCSYAAAAWAWDPNHHKFISRRSQKHARLDRHLTERTELLKELVRFLLRFLLSFFLFVFLLFLPFPPSPSLSSPDPRAFFAELELERSNASVHFAMHRKNPAETAENQKSELSRVFTCCDIRKESWSVLSQNRCQIVPGNLSMFRSSRLLQSHWSCSQEQGWTGRIWTLRAFLSTASALPRCAVRCLFNGPVARVS